jgi:hypothetical protein
MESLGKQNYDGYFEIIAIDSGSEMNPSKF